MKCIERVFNGKEFVQVIYKGRSAYIATEVARVLDYAQIRNFSKFYRTRKPPLVPGKEYEVLTGVKLARFKDLLHAQCKDSRRFVHAKKIVLFYTKGLLRCLPGVKNPVARSFAAFIQGRVRSKPAEQLSLLQDTRTHKSEKPSASPKSYSLEATKKLVRFGRLPRVGEGASRGGEKLSREKVLDMLQGALAKYDGKLSPESELGLVLTICENLTGASLTKYKPAVPPFKTPSELAEELGVSVSFVGHVVTTLGIRDDAEYTRWYVGFRKHSFGQVLCYWLTPKACAAVKEHFAKKRHLIKEDAPEMLRSVQEICSKCGMVRVGEKTWSSSPSRQNSSVIRYSVCPGCQFKENK